jgi:chromosome segregation ATPase
MTPLPAAPSPVAANALGDTHSQAMRAARRLPDAAQLRKGAVRSAVEQAQALYARRERAKQRTSELLGERRAMHAQDVAGAEQAAVDGTPFQAQLPAIDQELAELATQLGGLGRNLTRALTAVEDARLDDDGAAVEPAARRLARLEEQITRLEGEITQATAEANACRATVEWAQAPGALRPSEAHLSAGVGDLTHAANVEAAAARAARS